MKFNIISHITTACNYDCSYCDVIKDKRNVSDTTFSELSDFFMRNNKWVGRWKFFGGEPLLAKNKIIEFIHKFPENKNFEIVTNTTLLNDKVARELSEKFCLIFFSIDAENPFDYDKVISLVQEYNLEKKLYFNIIVDPENVGTAQKQFSQLYNLGIRGYNILPIYFTKPWQNHQLKEFSVFMKHVLDSSLEDQSIRLYGFQENKGYDASLINPSIFIDVDGKIYYSDFVSTFLGKKIKSDLYLGELKTYSLENMSKNDFEKQQKALSLLENTICQAVTGQKQLHKIMDYFSEYLNSKNNGK